MRYASNNTSVIRTARPRMVQGHRLTIYTYSLVENISWNRGSLQHEAGVSLLRRNRRHD